MKLNKERIKEEIRILGIDDSPFISTIQREVLVVGVVMRGASSIDGVMSTWVEVDGMDATKKIIEMVNRSRHRKQLRVIMLNGITLGGFNVVDITEVYEKTALPVIAITRKLPDFEKIREALNNVEEAEKRWNILKRAGKLYEVEGKSKRPVRFQVAGMDAETAAAIIRKSRKRSAIPEPVRVAHLISSGICKGESKGRV